MITHIPFMPKIRPHEETIYGELYENIRKEAEKFGKDEHDFSASFELNPDPRGEEYGHYLMCRVTYLKGDLNKIS